MTTTDDRRRRNQPRSRQAGVLPALLVLPWLASTCPPGMAQDAPSFFTEVGESTGTAVVHIDTDDPTNPFRQVAGGAAAGDIDDDGWPDLYVIGGDGARQYLLRNRGDGSFEDVTAAARIGFPGESFGGPLLADIDGDRDLDLFLGTVGFSVDRGPRLLRNDGPHGFTEIARGSEMFPAGPYTNATFGDYDGDGRLDLFTAHWAMVSDFFTLDHLWRNLGDGRFVASDEESGLVVATEPSPLSGTITWSFTANFVDIDSDGRPDLLLASDYGLSQVFRNLGSGRFADISTDVLTDENGMGSAIGDFDNDGLLDWFVTAIHDPTQIPDERWGKSGNRLYRNRGDGGFDDVTEAAGVRDGDWGWGACAADFDNDGWIDLFHVNGWLANDVDRWFGTPARLFHNRGDGTFHERAEEWGIADRGEGRGVVCFDYDRDGDIDVFVANINGPARLYRNDIEGDAAFLQVRLVGAPPNTEAIGARIVVRTNDGARQIRELRAGSNFVSQDPPVAHFGLGNTAPETSLEVQVHWPHDAGRTVVEGIRPNGFLVLRQAHADANCDGATSAADLAATIRALASAMSAAPCPGGDLDYDGEVSHADVATARAGIFAQGHGESPTAP